MLKALPVIPAKYANAGSLPSTRGITAVLGRSNKGQPRPQSPLLTGLSMLLATGTTKAC